MKVLLNLIGLLLTLGSAITVLQSFRNWHGILREGMFFFVFGFVFFSSGFIWNLFISGRNTSSTDLVFFSLGSAFLLFGAKKLFSFNVSRT